MKLGALLRALFLNLSLVVCLLDSFATCISHPTNGYLMSTHTPLFPSLSSLRSTCDPDFSFRSTNNNGTSQDPSPPPREGRGRKSKKALLADERKQLDRLAMGEEELHEERCPMEHSFCVKSQYNALRTRVE